MPWSFHDSGREKDYPKGTAGVSCGKGNRLGIWGPKKQNQGQSAEAKGRHNTFYFNQVQRVRLLVSLTPWPITIKEGPDSCPELPRRDDLNWKDSFSSVRMARQYSVSCGGCWDRDDSDRGQSGWRTLAGSPVSLKIQPSSNKTRKMGGS